MSELTIEKREATRKCLRPTLSHSPCLSGRSLRLEKRNRWILFFPFFIGLFRRIQPLTSVWHRLRAFSLYDVLDSCQSVERRKKVSSFSWTKNNNYIRSYWTLRHLGEISVLCTSNPRPSVIYGQPRVFQKLLVRFLMYNLFSSSNKSSPKRNLHIQMVRTHTKVSTI